MGGFEDFFLTFGPAIILIFIPFLTHLIYLHCF